MKDFINNFYSYDFTGIIHNDNSSDQSDIDIYLELTENKTNKEVEASAPVVDDKVTSKLLRHEKTCIVIDDGKKSLL